MLFEKTAIVTGAASGIGYAVAQALRQEGAQVVMADVNEALLIESARELGGVPFVGNLTRREDCRRLVEFTVERFGGVDILANVAGVQHVCPIEEFPEDKWDFIISLMLTAPFLLTRYCWPYMKEKGWGRIINMSSIHGLVASEFKSAYVSAKHGLVGFYQDGSHGGWPPGHHLQCHLPGLCYDSPCGKADRSAGSDPRHPRGKGHFRYHALQGGH